MFPIQLKGFSHYQGRQHQPVIAKSWQEHWELQPEEKSHIHVLQKAVEPKIINGKGNIFLFMILLIRNLSSTGTSSINIIGSVMF